jgi:LPS sulfotransferase NodH
MERMAHQTELWHGQQDGEDGTSDSCGTAFGMERMAHQTELWHGLQDGEDGT